MAGRLRFKGGGGPAGRGGGGAGDGGESRKRKKKDAAEAEDQPQEGWVRAETDDDLSGPLFWTASGNELCVAVTDGSEPTLKRVAFDEKGKPEPDDVSKVFVALRVKAGTITLKSSLGKYLSSDKFGVVTVDADAAGPQQEWQYTLRPDGVSLESAYGKYLKFEEKTLTLRADSEEAGFCEVFQVYCQAARRKPAKRKNVEEKSVAELEQEHARKFQSWGYGRVSIKGEESTLRKARQEGALYETMLDRREQTKSDKFCK